MPSQPLLPGELPIAVGAPKVHVNDGGVRRTRMSDDFKGPKPLKARKQRCRATLRVPADKRGLGPSVFKCQSWAHGTNSGDETHWEAGFIRLKGQIEPVAYRIEWRQEAPREWRQENG